MEKEAAVLREARSKSLDAYAAGQWGSRVVVILECRGRRIAGNGTLRLRPDTGGLTLAVK